MKERKFGVKLKIRDDRKSNIQRANKYQSTDSPLARAVRGAKPRADYKPPIHGRKKK